MSIRFVAVRCVTYLCPHLEFNDLDFVGYDRWFVALVESVIEHLDCIVMKLVRKAWPVEGERHVIAVG